MKTFFKNLWNDDVKSEVVGGVILAIIGFLYAWVQSFFSGKSMQAFLTHPVTLVTPVWLLGLIAITIIISVWLARRKHKEALASTMNLPRSTTNASTLSKETLGIQVTSLVNRQKVGSKETVSGTFVSLPANMVIRVLKVNEDMSKGWLSTRHVTVDMQNKIWTTVVYFGSTEDANKTLYLVVYLDREESDYLFDQFVEVSRISNKWLLFKYPLPKHLIECQRIKLERI